MMWRILIIFFLGLFNLSNLFAQIPDTLKVGIIKYKSQQDFVATYEPFINYIAQEIGSVPYYEIVDEEELGYKLINQEFHLGIFTPFPYLKAKLSFPQLEVFGSHLANGEAHYYGSIIVRKDSDIQNFDDLEGRPFLFVKETSTSGFKYPKGIFKEHNIDIDSAFFDYDFSGSHAESVIALLDERADGIAIDESGIEDFMPSDQQKLRKLERYEVPYQAYVFAPDLPKLAKDKISEVMFNAHRMPASRTKNMFENPLNIMQWVERNDDYYNVLRRYLRIVRVKPSIKLKLKGSDTAISSFEEAGDVLKILEDDIMDHLRQSKRFSNQIDTSLQNYYQLEVDIAQIGKEYRCQAYLQGRGIDRKRILSENTDLKQLQTSIPPMIIMKVLNALPIQTELIYNGESWFITYGTNDGLDEANYEFIVNLPDGTEHHIEAGGIKQMTDLNTFFNPKEAYQRDLMVSANFVQKNLRAYLRSQEDTHLEETGFWDHLDNIWGVIGIIVAVVSLALGSFFTRRKHRRFRRMLDEANQLLKEYIDGKYKLDNKVIEQKQKIGKFLEKGHISENQFLILKHRLEDIHEVINALLVNSEAVPPEVREEVREIMKDGVITEKEYTQLMKLVKNLG